MVIYKYVKYQTWIEDNRRKSFDMIKQIGALTLVFYVLLEVFYKFRRLPFVLFDASYLGLWLGEFCMGLRFPIYLFPLYDFDKISDLANWPY